MIKPALILIAVSILVYVLVVYRSKASKQKTDSDTKFYEEKMASDSEGNMSKIDSNLNNKSGWLKIYKSKVSNASISLEQKVDTSKFISLIPKEEHRNRLANTNYVYMWDFGVRATEHIKRGDRLWILTGDKLYETELDFIISDEDGKIGDAIGWTRQFGGAWKNVAIFKSCNKHDSIPPWINKAISGKKEVVKNFYKVD